LRDGRNAASGDPPNSDVVLGALEERTSRLKGFEIFVVKLEVRPAVQRKRHWLVRREIQRDVSASRNAILSTLIGV